jgi:hypothetical protein
VLKKAPPPPWNEMERPSRATHKGATTRRDDGCAR